MQTRRTWSLAPPRGNAGTVEDRPTSTPPRSPGRRPVTPEPASFGTAQIKARVATMPDEDRRRLATRRHRTRGTGHLRKPAPHPGAPRTTRRKNPQGHPLPASAGTDRGCQRTAQRPLGRARPRRDIRRADDGYGIPHPWRRDSGVDDAGGMGEGGAERVRPAAADAQVGGLARWAAGRQPYLDNLKVVLIAVIIVIHAVLGYASIVEVWTYTELREVTLAPVTEGVLFVLTGPVGLVLIALLFLVAGLLTPPSVDRKGPGRFVGDRLVRLGVPFGMYVLLVQPTLTYALEHRLGAAPGSYGAEYLGEERQLDTGPLWFVGVLLIFSLVYAGWRAGTDRRRRTRSTRGPSRTVTLRALMLVAAVVAATSFAVRVRYPYGSDSGFADLNFWQWPACIAVFGLGVRACRQGWLTAVPERLARRCRALTLAGVAAMAALLTGVGLLDAVDDALGGGTGSLGPSRPSRPCSPSSGRYGCCTSPSAGWTGATAGVRCSPAAPTAPSCCRRCSCSGLRSPCARSGFPPKSRPSSSPWAA